MILAADSFEVSLFSGEFLPENKMRLPPLLRDLLDSDHGVRAIVDSAIGSTKDIITDRPDFFPEYTDHGPFLGLEFSFWSQIVYWSESESYAALFAAVAISVTQPKPIKI